MQGCCVPSKSSYIADRRLRENRSANKTGSQGEGWNGDDCHVPETEEISAQAAPGVWESEWWKSDTSIPVTGDHWGKSVPQIEEAHRVCR